MLGFRMELAKQLIGDYVENERAVLATITAGHFPEEGTDPQNRCQG